MSKHPYLYTVLSIHLLPYWLSVLLQTVQEDTSSAAGSDQPTSHSKLLHYWLSVLLQTVQEDTSSAAGSDQSTSHSKLLHYWLSVLLQTVQEDMSSAAGSDQSTSHSSHVSWPAFSSGLQASSQVLSTFYSHRSGMLCADCALRCCIMSQAQSILRQTLSTRQSSYLQ